MPDFYYLRGPEGASVLNIGSWLQADPGPDFDTEDVMENIRTQSVAVDGARFVSERGRVRRFAFPLLLASGPAGSLDAVTGMLRRHARPGGTIDLQPQGVPTGEMVRFDVLGGELAERYNVHVQKLSRRVVDLLLDVQPFGYMPTWIVVGSIASMALPGTLRFASAPELGDVPGFAQIAIQPRPHDSLPATSYPGGSWTQHAVFWSLNASSYCYQPVASNSSLPITVELATAAASAMPSSAHPPHSASYGGAYAFHVNAPVGEVGHWRTMFAHQKSLAQALAGSRHRVWLYARSQPSAGIPVMLRVDATNDFLYEDSPLATGGAIASLPNQSPSGGLLFAASPAYQMVDCGLVTMPSAPAGGFHSPHIRFSAQVASNVPSMQVHVGGVFYQRVDGPHGTLLARLNRDAWGNRLLLDGRERTVRQLDGVATNGDIADDTGGYAPKGVPAAFYRGDFPMIGASIAQIDVAIGTRKTAAGATSLPAHTAPMAAAVGVRYQPRFAFTRGI